MAVFLISWTESEIEIMSSVIQHSTFHIPIRPGNNGQKEPTWRMATAKLPFPLIQFFMITSIQRQNIFFQLPLCFNTLNCDCPWIQLGYVLKSKTLHVQQKFCESDFSAIKLFHQVIKTNTFLSKLGINMKKVNFLSCKISVVAINTDFFLCNPRKQNYE